MFFFSKNPYSVAVEDQESSRSIRSVWRSMPDDKKQKTDGKRIEKKGKRKKNREQGTKRYIMPDREIDITS